MGDYVGNQPQFATTPVQTAVGDGTANPITLITAPGAAEAIHLFINGIAQTPGIHFTVYSNLLTPTGIIPMGYPILIVYKAVAVQLGSTTATAVSFDNAGTNIQSTNVDAVLKEMNSRSGAVGTGSDRLFFENDTFMTNSYTIGQSSFRECTIDNGTGNVILVDHGFAVGSPVHFKSTVALPSPMALTDLYQVFYVSTIVTPSTFRFSATEGGADLTGMTGGSGLYSCSKVKNAFIVGEYGIVNGAELEVPTGSELAVV